MAKVKKGKEMSTKEVKSKRAKTGEDSLLSMISDPKIDLRSTKSLLEDTEAVLENLSPQELGQLFQPAEESAVSGTTEKKPAAKKVAAKKTTPKKPSAKDSASSNTAASVASDTVGSDKGKKAAPKTSAKKTNLPDANASNATNEPKPPKQPHLFDMLEKVRLLVEAEASSSSGDHEYGEDPIMEFIKVDDLNKEEPKAKLHTGPGAFPNMRVMDIPDPEGDEAKAFQDYLRQVTENSQRPDPSERQMEVPRDLGRVPGDELDLADLDYVDSLGMANAGNSVSIVDSNESLKASVSDAELEEDSIKDINERYSVRVHEYARNNDHPDKAGSHVVKNDEWDYAKRLAKSLMLPVDEIWDPVEKRVLNSYRNSPAGKYLARHNMVLVEEKAKQKANSPTKKDLYKLMKDRGVADETKSGRGVSEDLDIQGILDSMELEKDEDEESGDGRREEQEGKGGGGYAPTARGGIEVPLSLGAVKKEGNAVDASLLAPKFVVRSRAWYQRGLRLFVKLTSFLVLVVVLETILLFHFALKEKESRYFAVSSDLRLIEMRALTEPQVSSQALLNWTSETVTKTLSLDFLYWKKKLMEVRGSYDPDGFRTLVNSLEDGGHLEKIRLERLSLSAVPSDAPVIVSQGIKNGRMTWKVELPLIISYQSSAGIAATQRLLAEVWVERVTSSANPLGIVIRQLVLGKTT